MKPGHVTNGFYQTRLMRQTDAERIATALSTQEGILRAEAVPARHVDSAFDWFVLVIPAGMEAGYQESAR